MTAGRAESINTGMPPFLTWLLRLFSLHSGADAAFAWLAALSIAVLLVALVVVCLAVLCRALRFFLDEFRKLLRGTALAPNEGIWDPLATRRRLRAQANTAQHEDRDGATAERRG